MALPISTPPAEMSVEEAMGMLSSGQDTLPISDEIPIESEPADELLAPQDEGKANVVVAGYKDPQMGPFLCANCQYYMDDNSCLLVSGFIEEGAVCNLFTQLTGYEEEMEDLAPVDDFVPVVEEVAEELIVPEDTEISAYIS